MMYYDMHVIIKKLHIAGPAARPAGLTLQEYPLADLEAEVGTQYVVLNIFSENTSLCHYKLCHCISTLPLQTCFQNDDSNL